MKEIINGMLYDTATAKHLGEWQSSPDSSSPDHCVLTLFQKRNGEFFLVCSGEGAEHYVYHISDGFTGRTKRILPLSPEDASAWAEDYLSADEYIAAFGNVSEDDGYMSSYLLLPTEVMMKAQEAATVSGIDFSGYIERLIQADKQSA